MSVLIVEDDPRVAELIVRGLEAAGLPTRWVDDGLDGLAAALDPRVGLVVLDLELPSLSGHDVLARVRTHRPLLPVLILSARGSLDDRVRGLGAGAADYVAKPFAVAELVARVAARYRNGVGGGARRRVGRVELEPHARAARYDRDEVRLSDREYEVLTVLLERSPGTVTSAELQRRVWSDAAITSNAVAATVRRLRGKLPLGAIETLPGAGYRLVG